MSQDEPSAVEGSVVSQIWGKIPEPVRAKAIEQKARFLAAKKSTQYAVAASLVVLTGLLFSLVGNSSNSEKLAPFSDLD
ncbi:MAG: hypothetical protein JKY29_07400, partial [Gammaproteobacteria bacterium]|nr:hypothetical protein [Gammaproteobacteria bacterium]